MLKMMDLSKIGSKEQFLYMPNASARHMINAISIYSRQSGGIVLLSASVIYAFVVIKCTKFGLEMFFRCDHILKSGHK